jgi:hypothetical protein
MNSPRLGFAYLEEGETVPETAVNNIATYLEAASGLFNVLDRDLTAPPGSEAQLDTYLVAAGATGTWAGQDGKLAVIINTAYTFIAPLAGWIAWVDDEGGYVGFNGATWDPLGLTVDNDTTLASDSTATPPTVHAVKTYVDGKVTGLLDLKGNQDCSANPNYPAASKGDAYVVSVAGKIGGAAGTTVAVGDWIVATADNAGGDQATVGASWSILEHNLTSVLSASFASAAEIQVGTVSDKVIAPDQLHLAHAPQTLTDGATISWDMAAGFNAKVTLGGNHTFGTPTNPKAGMTYTLGVIQDATGGRVPVLPTCFKFGSAGAPTFSTGAGKRDFLFLYCYDASTPEFRAVFNKDA